MRSDECFSCYALDHSGGQAWSRYVVGISRKNPAERVSAMRMIDVPMWIVRGADGFFLAVDDEKIGQYIQV